MTTAFAATLNSKVVTGVGEITLRYTVQMPSTYSAGGEALGTQLATDGLTYVTGLSVVASGAVADFANVYTLIGATIAAAGITASTAKLAATVMSTSTEFAGDLSSVGDLVIEVKGY